jgi:capsid protein
VPNIVLLSPHRNGRTQPAARAVRPRRVGGDVRMRYGANGRVIEPMALTKYGAEGYYAARELRNSGRLMPITASADYHIRDDVEALRAQSQELDRNNGIYQAITSRFIDVICGDGFVLQPKTGDKELDAKLLALWTQFETDPEVRGLHDGRELDRMALRSVLIDGDTGAIKTRGGRLQMIEADRISSGSAHVHRDRNVDMGVRQNAEGRPLEFWVVDYDDYGRMRQEPRKISAADFIYLAHLTRPSQTRGVPVQTCNFAMIHRLNDVCDSEAAAWQLLSRLAVSINSEGGAGVGAGIGDDDDSATEIDLAKRIQDVGTAIGFFGQPGDKITGIERNIPGQNFSESVKMFLRLIGLPMGMSLEFVLLIWSDTTYSSGRASKMQVERSCRPWARKLCNRFKTPTYRWQVARWIGQGLIPYTPAVFEHVWHNDAYPSFNENEDEKARMGRHENGNTTWTRELKRSGIADRDSFAEELEADLDLAGGIVERHNARHPNARVTLGDFTPFAKVATRSVATTDDAENDNGGGRSDESGR